MDDRQKGFELQYRYELSSPLGNLSLFSANEELTGLYFEGHSPDPKNTAGKLDAAPFRAVEDQLAEYFAGERGAFDVQIHWHGTEFQQQVWSVLRTIAIGQTMTYGQLAKMCRRPKAVRAVGAAVGRNPISIVVPCHRVVGARGALTGFAGGLERKRWLLEREQAGDPSADAKNLATRLS